MLLTCNSKPTTRKQTERQSPGQRLHIWADHCRPRSPCIQGPSKIAALLRLSLYPDPRLAKKHFPKTTCLCSSTEQYGLVDDVDEASKLVLSNFPTWCTQFPFCQIDTLHHEPNLQMRTTEFRFEFASFLCWLLQLTDIHAHNFAGFPRPYLRLSKSFDGLIRSTLSEWVACSLDIGLRPYIAPLTIVFRMRQSIHHRSLEEKQQRAL